MRALVGFLTFTVAALIPTVWAAGTLPSNPLARHSSADADVKSSEEPPLQAAFVYPWFPNAWDQAGIYPYTNYTPSLGLYDSRDDAVIDEQLRLAASAPTGAFLSSWWGPGHP